MSGPHIMLALAEAYLAERRSLGFKLDRSGSLTLAFARFADATGHTGPLTAAVVLRWAREKAQTMNPRDEIPKQDRPKPVTRTKRAPLIQPPASRTSSRPAVMCRAERPDI